MNVRTRIALACLVLLVLAGLSIWQTGGRTRAAPELKDELYLSEIPLQMRLYVPDTDAAAGDRKLQSYDVYKKGVLAQTRHIMADGSIEIVVFREDGEAKASSQLYYPRQAEEVVLRLRSAKKFAVNGDIASELNLRLDGTRRFVGSRLPDGNYTIISFYEDGETISTNQMLEGTGSTLLAEQRWSTKEKGHVLLSSNVRNPDRGRTITEYDARGEPLKVTTTGSYDTKSGTRVVAFFPGTDRKRLESVTDYTKTVARYYREDGTLKCIQHFSSAGTVTVTPYSQDGKTPLFEQMLSIFVNGGVPKYVLNEVTERHPDGEVSRKLSFSFDKQMLVTERRFAFTQGGIKYKEGVFTYRIEGSPEEVGTLAKSELTPLSGGAAIVKLHRASENIRARLAPAQLAPPEDFDNLPVPEPVSGGDGFT